MRLACHLLATYSHDGRRHNLVEDPVIPNVFIAALTAPITTLWNAVLARPQRSFAVQCQRTITMEYPLSPGQAAKVLRQIRFYRQEGMLVSVRVGSFP